MFYPHDRIQPCGNTLRGKRTGDRFAQGRRLHSVRYFRERDASGRADDLRDVERRQGAGRTRTGVAFHDAGAASASVGRNETGEVCFLNSGNGRHTLRILMRRACCFCSRCVLSGEMDRMRGRACAEPPYGTSCFVCWICFSFCRLSTPRRMRCDGKMKF